MSLVVTGATGHLGRLVVEHLLDRGVEEERIVATGRDLDKARDLADRGVDVRRADYDDRASLDAALAGAERVLLVSGNQVGRRVAQHRAVIEAARDAGASLVAYTSIAHADTSSTVLAVDHRATEAALREAGVPWVLLRNSWYLELYTDQVPTAVEHGVLLGSAGDGEISAATRADYAGAAAAVLTGDGHAGTTYELGGDEAFTMADVAKSITAATGTDVVYRDLPPEEHRAALVGVGLPEALADVLVDGDRAVAAGELRVDSGDLSRLLGRPTTTLEQALATWR